jgi:sugar lactone lactonase YvrE
MSSFQYANGMALSPDEQHLYVGSTMGGSIQVFDRKANKIGLMQLHPHDKHVLVSSYVHH